MLVKRLGSVLMCIALALIVVACGGITTPSTSSSPTVSTAPAASPKEGTMAFTIRSSAFNPGDPIPTQYTCSGQGISPALSWNGQPQNTASFALIADDPDAPRGVFTHWVVYDLPATVHELPEGVPTTDRLEDGGLQGRNSGNKIGYTPPCPPAGPAHHYHFKLYALAVPTLNLNAGASKDQVLSAMEGHVLAQSEAVGTYQRGG